MCYKIIKAKIALFLVISILCVTSAVNAEVDDASDAEIPFVKNEEIFGIRCRYGTVTYENGYTVCSYCCFSNLGYFCVVVAENASCMPGL